MTDSAAIPATGTLLSWREHRTAGATQAAYAEVGEVKAVTPPELQASYVEVTRQKDRFKRYKPTLLEIGQPTFTVHYDPADVTHKNAEGGYLWAWKQQTYCDFRITFPDASNLDFEGYFSNISTTAEKEGVLEQEITLRPSGEPTLP